MSEKLRGAIIGCGYFAQFHMDAWRRMPDVAIVAACDPQIDRARGAAPAAFEDPAVMLEQIQPDFLDIATRPETHPDLVVLAAAHGVNAICQKPMATDLEQARQMAAVASSAGIRLMIHENWRWQAWYRKAAELIRGGAIGMPISYGLRTRKRDGVGPEPYAAQPYFRTMPRLLIYEVLVHHIDVARWLFGEIDSVYAVTRRRNKVISGEDQALLTLTHASAVDGWIDANRHNDPVPDGPVAGDAIFEGDTGVLTVSSSGDLFLNGAATWQNSVRAGYRGDSVYATQRHFIDCLRCGAEFETSAANYLNTVAAVEAAYASVNERAAVAPARFLADSRTNPRK